MKIYRKKELRIRFGIALGYGISNKLTYKVNHSPNKQKPKKIVFKVHAK